jgi:hypothetical protein
MPPAASVKHWCRRRDRGAGQPGSELFESKPLSQNRGLVVQFYLTDAFLLDTVVRFIEDSLCDGEPAIALLTKSHREGVDQRLALRGLDVAALLAQGLYVPLDAAETLSKFMVDRWPSEPRFNIVIGDLIGRVAAQSRRPVKIFGEMVALLWKEGNARGAIRLEELWNNLAKKISFSLLCAYPLETLSRDTSGANLLDVCAEHSEVIAGENETADLHRHIAGAVGSIRRSLTDIKTKLAALNLQKSSQ